VRSLLDALLMAVLVALIVLPPLALGAVATWARGLVLCGAFLLLGLWLVREAWLGELRVARLWAWLWIGLFFAAALFQLIPLPGEVVRVLSPATFETWKRVLPERVAGGLTLSLFPYGTATTLLWFLAPAIVFFVTVHVVRSRRQAATIIGALVVLSLFEVLYGSWEQFSGRRHVFWLAREEHLAAVTGTYLNKNHFAGLLEMILPAALGLLVGIVPRARSEGTVRARVAAVASSRTAHLPLVLAWAVAVIVAGVYLSMSRAGMVSALLALVALALCMGLTAGFRKYTLFLLLVVFVILLIAAGIGSDIFVERIETAAAGRSTSWNDRMDLARSGMRMAATYPVTGTGLGSFRYAFQRFQSMRFGDRVADYLHNDWLQVVCEMGLPGLGIVLAGMASVVVGTVRLVRRRRDPFCRWVSVGSLIGLAVMLLHSLFDYNLYKITANVVVFAAIAGVAVAAARMPSRGGSRERGSWLVVPLGGVPARAMLAGAVAIGIVTACRLPLRLARADLAFHRFLAVADLPGGDPYFMLPRAAADGSRSVSDRLGRARRLNPWNPAYDHAAAAWFVRRAEEFMRDRSQRSISRLLRESGGAAEHDAVRRLEEAVRSALGLRVWPERVQYLREALAAARRAVTGLPVAAEYHVQTAEILASLERMGIREGEGSGGGESASLAFARRARWLAPNVPEVLCRAGTVMLAAGVTNGSGERRNREIDECLNSFRRALAADPAYAERIFPAVRRALPDVDGLKLVTPATLAAKERLARELEAQGAWEELLACLDTMEGLLERREKTSTGNGLSADAHAADGGSGGVMGGVAAIPPVGVPGETRSPTEVRLAIARRRCAVLGLLQRWEERRRAVARYREYLRRCLDERVAEALRSSSHARSRDLMEELIGVLDEDWGNPRALLVAARTSLRHGATDGLPGWNEPLDFLFRLVMRNERLDADVPSRVEDLLRQAPPSDEEGRLIADFVRAAAALRTGAAAEAVRRLEALAARRDEAAGAWRQRHLIWYFLGLAREELGETDGAVSAYKRAIEIVPTHRPTLLRLARLRPGARSRLSALTPQVPCGVEFGGRIAFLGYDLEREGASLGLAPVRRAGRWSITYYWQLQERMYRGYQPSVKFCDEAGRILFTDDHILRGPNDGPYPVDFPRCGEVIVEKRSLRDLPPAARYLHVGIYAPDPPRPLPHNLYFDSGAPLFVTTLRRPQAAPLVAAGTMRGDGATVKSAEERR